MQQKSMLHAIKTVTTLALPISASGIIQVMANFIAMMMVAKLGQEWLAAGALAVTTYIFIITITSTIFYSISILMGQHHSNHVKNGLIVKNGLWCALFLACPAALLLWFADYILILFGQNHNLILLTKNYFHYASFGLFPLLINSVLAQFFAGSGRPKLTMFISLIQLPITISFAYCFVFGKYGFPMLGLGGISCATLIAQSLITLSVLILLYLNDQKYQLFAKPILPDQEICKKILYLGLPVGLQFGGEMGAMSVATYLMGHLGVIALAASQVVSQYAVFVVMLKTGLTQALSILTSKTYNQKEFAVSITPIIKEYLHAAIIILCGIFIIVAILFCVFPLTLINLYVDEQRISPNLIYLSSIFFKINTCILFMDGLRHLFSGTLRGLYDSQAPMRIGVISLWGISLPLSYLFGFTFNGGPIGLRIGFACGFCVATILLWQRLKKALGYK
jgi:multidrug resistance protein, MATE family